MFNGELSGGRCQPVGECGQLGLVEFEELNAGLSLRVVLFLMKIGDFLLYHVLADVENSLNY